MTSFPRSPNVFSCKTWGRWSYVASSGRVKSQGRHALSAGALEGRVARATMAGSGLGLLPATRRSPFVLLDHAWAGARLLSFLRRLCLQAVLQLRGFVHSQHHSIPRSPKLQPILSPASLCSHGHAHVPHSLSLPP